MYHKHAGRHRIHPISIRSLILQQVALLHRRRPIEFGHLGSEQRSRQGKIMLSRLICPLLACFSGTLLAKPLQDVDDQTLETDLGDLHLPSTSNASLSSAAGTGSNDMSVKCDGNKYGFKPDVHDCTTALQRQAEGSERIRFGQRNSTSEDYFFHLPYRLMGGM